MRNQWRLFLLRHQNHHFHTPSNVSRSLSLIQVTSQPTFSLSHSAFPSFSSSFNHPILRHFSSISEKSSDPLILIDIFTKPINGDEIKKELDTKNVVFTPDLIPNVLKNLNSDPKTAIKFFDWVLEKETGSLSSRAYNFMLGVLGSNGLFKEFWDVVDLMIKRGYWVKKGAVDFVIKRFEKDGSENDLKQLKDLYSYYFKKYNMSIEKASSRVSDVIMREVWDENVEKELKNLDVDYSNLLVKRVLENLSEKSEHHMKGLIFFRWVEESGLFKHDQVTYNAMALALLRRNCFDRFWIVVEDMRNAGHEFEMETYILVSKRFMKVRMLEGAVRLFEYAMDWANKPSRQDCTFLLRKIVCAKELDMDFFSRVIKVYTEKGNALDDSMLDSVLKALTSVGRMNMYNKVLGAMAECGFRPSETMKSRVAFDLSSAKMKDEANKFMVKLEDCETSPDVKTWVSLIEGHCISGDLEKARDCLEKLIELEGASSAGNALDLLVIAYCNRERATEACKHISNLVKNKGLKLKHGTYKALISKLLVQKRFQEGSSLLDLMKSNGFPPFVDPFISYLAKKGTPDEAISFFKAMTSKGIPSTKVFIRVFDGYFEAGRHNQAQILLAKCPEYIRNHPDVLNLFCSMKPENPANQTDVAA
ncbi:pentatricopeptide repeat-containing protein At3g02490, mitochondrial-like [Amaranthus tricolor]|uniref:pentatricopeptide repeat-containing protein At3g02490, mitochondrial-like n=1 Tax=Amaranthus tricolor TaxID=29722 RepID=UPI0025858197|nr:pentatricopeptide repeat-containing protein At3g02490, mitochondrial-like [Amaranthus tricolor]